MQYFEIKILNLNQGLLLISGKDTPRVHMNLEIFVYFLDAILIQLFS